MTDKPNTEPGDATEVPLPGDNESERQRIRSSNDRDQQLEREGQPSRHNRGYDEAADRASGDVPENVPENKEPAEGSRETSS